MSDLRVSEDDLVQKLQTLGIPLYDNLHRGDPFSLNPVLPKSCQNQYGCFEEIMKDMTPIVIDRNKDTNKHKPRQNPLCKPDITSPHRRYHYFFF